ncbi:sodium-dependent transporter [Geobacter pickeringii]|uniref:Transporter n=1 Tax=Geobacter pickeringii TaxID=345632 RepID=A0A0B5BC03_9BACT|nr:sodium-dependent transporter [Geobacter pickeringii]AJE02559.1 transporter [Geobacter pickeringii]
MSSQPATERRNATVCPADAGKPRDAFTTSLGIIAATLGSAVGLGNIWKFPSLTGANGGAAFLVIYLVSTLLVGLPVMISELMLGRQAKSDAITTLRTLAPRRQPWWLVGAAGALAAFLILAFYTEVAGWVFAYIVKAAAGGLLTTDPAVTSKAFTILVADPAQSLFWQWLVLAVIGSIIVLGVSKGIEKTTKRLMPVLFLLLVAIGVRSLTLPGASAGLAFLFRPDFSKVTGTTILTAMGLSFFKLSTGMGTMITYGSYFRDDQNVPMTAIRVMLADLTVSLLAGIAVFPAVFAFGFKPEAGPSLLFITIPAVFAAMPFGSVFMVLFFILAAIAATGAMLSLLEVPVAFLHEHFCLPRLKATAITVLLLGLLGSTAALSGSVLATVTPFGMTFFDLYDFLTSNLLLPVGGMMICIFTGWVYGFGRVEEALSNGGVIANARVIRIFFGIVKFISPLLVLTILLKGLKVF